MADSCCAVPGWHVVFGKQWNFQHFGAGNDDLLAGGGHGLAGDAVHLVEGVGPQVAIVGRANEHLQVHRLLAVAQQLRGGHRNSNRLETPTAYVCAHHKHTMSPKSLQSVVFHHKLLQTFSKQKTEYRYLSPNTRTGNNYWNKGISKYHDYFWISQREIFYLQNFYIKATLCFR